MLRVQRHGYTHFCRTQIVKTIQIGEVTRRNVNQRLEPLDIPYSTFNGWVQAVERGIDDTSIQLNRFCHKGDWYAECRCNFTYAGSGYHTVWELESERRQYHLSQFWIIPLNPPINQTAT